MAIVGQFPRPGLALLNLSSGSEDVRSSGQTGVAGAVETAHPGHRRNFGPFVQPDEAMRVA
jgi:hypothetical protein